jgi:DNA-binding CsgD family transcriptional regulator
LLSTINEKQGDYQSALLYHKKYFIQNDSIYGLEKLKSINNLQLEYERYKNEKEVEILTERNKRSKLRNLALWVGLGLLVALFGAVLYAFRQKLQKSKLSRLQVEQELDHKKQELIAFALQLAHKNEVLEDVKSSINEWKESQNKSMNSIIKKIDFNKNDERSWGEFRERFVAVHKNFESDIQKMFPDVTASELRLMALIKMTLTNKEIASILNITPAGIKKARYRLRKKLDLNTSDSLEKFIYNI